MSSQHGGDAVGPDRRGRHHRAAAWGPDGRGPQHHRLRGHRRDRPGAGGEGGGVPGRAGLRHGGARDRRDADRHMRRRARRVRPGEALLRLHRHHDPAPGADRQRPADQAHQPAAVRHQRRRARRNPAHGGEDGARPRPGGRGGQQRHGAQLRLGVLHPAHPAGPLHRRLPDGPRLQGPGQRRRARGRALRPHARARRGHRDVPGGAAARARREGQRRHGPGLRGVAGSRIPQPRERRPPASPDGTEDVP